MGWSTRLFLVREDGGLHRLAGAAFTRMLKADGCCRAPDFAGQRVRQASITIELSSGIPLGVRHVGFAVLDFDQAGHLDVARFNAQQVARLDVMLQEVLDPAQPGAEVVHAGSRFVARGGTWEPDPVLRRRLDEAALGRLSCPRVKVID